MRAIVFYNTSVVKRAKIKTCRPGGPLVSEQRVERKLAAILVADVVGYSRLAESDEDRTLARLRALRSDLIDPTLLATLCRQSHDHVAVAFARAAQ